MVIQLHRHRKRIVNKASESEWSNQKQDSISQEKKNLHGNDRYLTYIGTIPLNVSYKSMSGTLLGSYMPQNVSFSPKYISGILPTTKYQLLSINHIYLEMLGTCISYSRYTETVRY